LRSLPLCHDTVPPIHYVFECPSGELQGNNGGKLKASQMQRRGWTQPGDGFG
jgi:hypothetical protein